MNNVTNEPQNMKVCEESNTEPRIIVEESQVALLKERIRELEEFRDAVFDIVDTKFKDFFTIGDDIHSLCWEYGKNEK